MKSTSVNIPTDRPRKKDATSTRADILEAARIAFTHASYDAVGLREIAATAGISAALVNRYFGGKEALFAEAVPSAFSIVELLAEPRSAFGRRVVDYLSLKPKDGERFDATIAMLRSASSHEARAMLSDGLEKKFVGPLAAWLDGPDAKARATMIVALLAGYSVLSEVLALEALTGETLEAARRLLAGQIQQLVDGAI